MLSVIDQWIKTEDREAFLMSRRLIKEEGLLGGGSSGSAMVAALKVAKVRPVCMSLAYGGLFRR